MENVRRNGYDTEKLRGIRDIGPLREPYDPSRLVPVDKRRVVEAYETWRRTASLPERGSGREAERLFYSELLKCFHLSRRNAPVKLGIPQSRSGLSNWRHSPTTQTARLRYDVCEYIRQLSGVDVTANRFLELEPLNISEMAFLGKVTSVPRAKQESSETARGQEFRIDRLEFTMSSAKSVKEGDLRPHADPVGRGPTIGATRYVLLEANISVENAHEMELEAGPQSAEVQIVSDREDPCNVRVVPVLPREALQATLRNLKLVCRMREKEGNLPVSVSVNRCHVKPIIEIDGNREVSRTELDTARQNLIDQIFRRRLPNSSSERLVLSRALGGLDE